MDNVRHRYDVRPQVRADGRETSYPRCRHPSPAACFVESHTPTLAADQRRLGLSQKTVRNYVSNILAKLHARDRTRLLVIAREAGYRET
ncbi:response regulator transcription factor [Kribbella jiaozuonensis]|uniref:Response regulator transcription factor n=1 Tax=Kribbella jiaozuonensis TaxID=2575441 RepID=A0A4U3LM25_9ACTN|nr:LuxR C-terminal-related transcriptional regulator [Kribbella jiaozuonensis]TKK76818.1 response regulator transcription factor [Kribbella jiaozuonensis]